MNSSPKSSGSAMVKTQTMLGDSHAPLVLAREAGVPFQPPLGNADPFAEWLSLMEVVQMLCPDGPVRDRPMLGKQWKL